MEREFDFKGIINLRSNFLPYSLSLFEGSRTAEFSLFCQSMVSDETIFEILDQNFSACYRASSFLGFFVATRYGQLALSQIPAMNGVSTVRFNDFIDARMGERRAIEIVTLASLELAKFLRCVVNDLCYIAFRRGRREEFLASGADEQHQEFITASGAFTRCADSFRSTVEYFLETSQYVTEEDDKICFENMEVKQMFGSLLRIFAVNVLFPIGDSYSFQANMRHHHSELDPEEMQIAIVEVTETIVALHARVETVEDTEEVSVLISSHVEKVMSLISGISDRESIKKMCMKTIKLAASKVATLKGLETEMVKSEVGRKTGQRRSTTRIDRITRTQRARFSHPATKKMMLQKMANGSLSKDVRESEKTVGNGDVYLMVDCSGSTLNSTDSNGLPLSVLFEAITLSVADAAIAADRAFTVFFYADRLIKTVSISPSDSPLMRAHKRRQMLCNAAYLGNDEYGSIVSVVEEIEKKRSRKKQPVSLLILSDGMMLTNYGVSKLKKALELRDKLSLLQHEGVRVLPILVFDSVDEAFSTLFRDNRFIHVRSSKDFDVKHIEEIMRFTVEVGEDEISSC